LDSWNGGLDVERERERERDESGGEREELKPEQRWTNILSN